MHPGLSLSTSVNGRYCFRRFRIATRSAVSMNVVSLTASIQSSRSPFPIDSHSARVTHARNPCRFNRPSVFRRARHEQ